MNPTPTESKLAQSILSAELALLKKKVADGQTLRAGERRHLLALAPERLNVREIAAYALVLAATDYKAFSKPGHPFDFESRIQYWIEKTEGWFDDLDDVDPEQEPTDWPTLSTEVCTGADGASSSMQRPEGGAA